MRSRLDRCLDPGQKRILFLVDRNNLGKQTLTEFQQYLSPYTNRRFTEECVVQRAAKNAIDPAAKGRGSRKRLG